MSQLEVLDPPVAVVWLPVGDLVVNRSFREGGLSPEHVERLSVLAGSWPPIVVDPKRVVIDGAHRVAAARRLGLARLEAQVFDGTPEEAFVEFVRRNVTHGLLLTLGERKRAAMRVLREHSQWSDRRVGEVCGLSSKTVGRLRSERCPTEESAQSDAVRVGRDNRSRPARRGLVRGRVVEALRAQPSASLRAIAAVAGVSPETVRLVRLNLAQTPTNEPTMPEPAELTSTSWRGDTALVSTEQGEDFLEWFEETVVSDTDLARIPQVPLSRVYEIADEARRRSHLWLEFARTLEARTTKSK